MSLTGRDTLDTTTTSETSNGGLGNTLDVVTKNLPVTLGAALAEALAALAACEELVFKAHDAEGTRLEIHTSSHFGGRKKGLEVVGNVRKWKRW
jgi:hypothetical protein